MCARYWSLPIHAGTGHWLLHKQMHWNEFKRVSRDASCVLLVQLQVTPVLWNRMALPQVAQRHCELTFIQADNRCKRLPNLALHIPLFKCKISPINTKTKTTPANDCLNDKLSQFFFLSLCNSLELSSSFCANSEREKGLPRCNW